MAKAIYKFNGQVVSREVFIENLIDNLENDESFNNSFDEMLDELYPPTEIMSVSFYASTILKEIDPIMYDMALTEQAEYRVNESVDYAELHEEELSYEFDEDTLTLTFEEEE